MLVIADFFFEIFNPSGRKREWLTLETLAGAQNDFLNRQFELTLAEATSLSLSVEDRTPI